MNCAGIAIDVGPFLSWISTNILYSTDILVPNTGTTMLQV